MKRPKPSHGTPPPPRSYSPPDLAVLLPRSDADSVDKPGGWMRNITQTLLDAMRFGPRPKPAPPPSDDGQDPRLLRSGLRQVASSEPRSNVYTGSSTYLPPVG
jgi:hypothetical protein